MSARRSLSPPPRSGESSSRSSRPTSPHSSTGASTPIHCLPAHGILKHREIRTSNDDLRDGLKSPPIPLGSTGAEGPLGHLAISRSSTLSVNTNPHYQKGVSFDTFESAGDGIKTGGGTGIDFSFTLQAKSIGYQKTRASREFLVATDLNEYSVHALNWLLANLVEDGDEVVVLRVVEPGSSTTRFSTDLGMQDDARQEAQDLMDTVMKTNQDARQLSLKVEFAVGKVENVIQRMIQVYRPDSLVVGTRGRSTTGWRGFLIGSTSRYMLERSPVPVVVVRPERKVHRDLEARRADPKRGARFADANSRGAAPFRPGYTRAHSDDAQAVERSSQDHDKPDASLKPGKRKDLELHRPKTAPA